MKHIKEEGDGGPANVMGDSSPSNPDSAIAMPERGLFFGPISRIKMNIEKKRKKKKKKLRKIIKGKK